MTDPIVHANVQPPHATITLNDPDRRNAMSLAMFDALDCILDELRSRDDVHVVQIHGNGPAFCAGFDLAAAVADPAVLESFVLRLSALMRNVRRLPQVVVAAVHGAAIAGGCALLTACDFVVVEPAAKIGYPVHRIGISPAVSAPTLTQAIGAGPARELMMSGRLIDGAHASRIGLASHCCNEGESALEAARTLCRLLAEHGPHALRVTKQWINELDGSLDDGRFDPVATDTASEALEASSVALLRKFWTARSRS